MEAALSCLQKGRDLTLLTRTQTSDKEYSDLMASTGGRQHRSLFPQHSTNLFTRNPVVCILEVDKACVQGVSQLLKQSGSF